MTKTPKWAVIILDEKRYERVAFFGEEDETIVASLRLYPMKYYVMPMAEYIKYLGREKSHSTIH